MENRVRSNRGRLIGKATMDRLRENVGASVIVSYTLHGHHENVTGTLRSVQDFASITLEVADANGRLRNSDYPFIGLNLVVEAVWSGSGKQIYNNKNNVERGMRIATPEKAHALRVQSFGKDAVDRADAEQRARLGLKPRAAEGAKAEKDSTFADVFFSSIRRWS